MNNNVYYIFCSPKTCNNGFSQSSKLQIRVAQMVIILGIFYFQTSTPVFLGAITVIGSLLTVK